MKARLPSLILTAAAAAAGASVLAQPAQPEFVWPERIANAKVLPADIGAERLRRTMVGFSRALGVRCTHCHVGPEGAPLSTLDFASDANPRKEVARGMIRMTDALNADTLPAILGPSQRTRVTCFTCHQGEPMPSVVPPPSPPAPPPRPATPATGERGGL